MTLCIIVFSIQAVNLVHLKVIKARSWWLMPVILAIGDYRCGSSGRAPALQV
jgi:hypothetical protein